MLSIVILLCPSKCTVIFFYFFMVSENKTEETFVECSRSIGVTSYSLPAMDQAFECDLNGKQ